MWTFDKPKSRQSQQRRIQSKDKENKIKRTAKISRVKYGGCYHTLLRTSTYAKSIIYSYRRYLGWVWLADRLVGWLVGRRVDWLTSFFLNLPSASELWWLFTVEDLTFCQLIGLIVSKDLSSINAYLAASPPNTPAKHSHRL